MIERNFNFSLTDQKTIELIIDDENVPSITWYCPKGRRWHNSISHVRIARQAFVILSAAKDLEIE